MNITEKTLDTNLIYKGKVFDVYKDIAELQNGNKADREVVKHSGGVCVLALTDSDEVVMVKQFRYAYGDSCLEIPAGKLEPGEDPLECGKRELLEETGYTAKKFELLGKLLPTPAYCTEVIHMYLARGLEKGESNLDEDEFLESFKLPFDKVVDMIFHDEIIDAKTQLAVLKAKVLLNN